MGISSYEMVLDEYFEHNFCTGSLSSKAFGDSESNQVYIERQSDRWTKKLQTTLLLLIDISLLTNFILFCYGMSQFLFIYCYYKQRPDIKSIKIHISHCTSILLDIHMAYAYKATITLSVQKYVYITKHKNITH